MRTLTSLLLIFAAATTASAQTVTLVADLPRLDRPTDLAVDAQGTVYAATEPDIACVSPTGEVHDLPGAVLDGEASHILVEDTGAVVVTDRGIFSQGVFLHRVLRITPDGVAAQIIDQTGDGLGHPLLFPGPLALDGVGGVLVCGAISNNVFRVTGSGQKQQILSQLSSPVAIDAPAGVAVDASDNVLVSFLNTDNVLSVSPAGVATQVMDLTGDGAGHGLEQPGSLCAGPNGDVYVVGTFSHNVFRIDADGIVTQVMDATGDGVTGLMFPTDVALDASGNLYVLAASRHVFKRTPAGVISAIFGPAGFGTGESLSLIPCMTVASDGTVFVAASGSHNLFRVSPDGSITELVQRQDTMVAMADLAVSTDGTAYVAGAGSDNVLRVETNGSVDTLLRSDQMPPAAPLMAPRSLAVDATDVLYVGNFGSDNVLRVQGGPTPSLTQVVSAAGFTDCLDVTVDTTGVVYSSWAAPGAVLRTEPGGAQSTWFNLADTRELDADASGAVFAMSRSLGSVYKQPVGMGLSTIIGPGGDGVHPLDFPSDIAVMPDGTIWVTGFNSWNVFRVDPDGTITQVMDATGDGAGNALQRPEAVVVDSQGNTYVLSSLSKNLLQISQSGDITLLMDETGDGLGHALVKPTQLAIDAADRLYVAEPSTNRLFRIEPDSTWKNLGGASPAGSNGIPTFTGAGSLTPGSSMVLSLTQSPPQAPLLIWLAFAPTPFAALGGTVWAWPYNVQHPSVSNALGSLERGLTWPAGIAPGIELTLQCIVQDTGVPAGITLSNALRAVTP